MSMRKYFAKYQIYQICIDSISGGTAFECTLQDALFIDVVVSDFVIKGKASEFSIMNYSEK